jgi:sugar phosphate isomerase/epimerase
MQKELTRRSFLLSTYAAGTGAVVLGGGVCSALPAAGPAETGRMKVGIVTYNIAKDWDVPTIIKNCTEAKYDGVELRTGHAHGVEITLTPQQRSEVKRQFDDSPVRIAQLGSTYEFHSLDPAAVRKNIEGCKNYIQLAADVGSPAVKVRPNGLQTKAGVPVEKTLEQIGRSLRELGQAGAGLNIEVRVEVHGPGTSRPEYIQKIMEIADHPLVTVNWNCNQTDMEGGTLEENFNRLAKKIRHVHMRDLFVEDYPWKKLVTLLSGIGFSGYCCAEVPESNDPIRVMKYFRALFLAYQSA